MHLIYKNDIRKGDVIFVLNIKSSLEESIKNLEIGYKGNRYNHVGLYLGDNKVIESRKNVEIVDFDEFIKYSDNTLIRRIKNDGISAKACDIALKYVGFPYNYTYVESKTKFYCSSLIHHVFNEASGQKFFKKHKLLFNDKENEISPFWIEYYNQYDMDVPIEEYGSNPSNLSKDKIFFKSFMYKNNI